MGGAGAHLVNGRFTAALIMAAVHLLGIDLVLDTALGVFTFMFCSAWCMAVVQMGCMTGLCNVFIAEWYQFTEALFVYTAAVLGCICAADFFRKNRRILSFIFLAAGYSCYQAAIAFYVFLILFFILKKYEYRFDIRGIRDMMIGAFECAGVFASNFLLTKLLILQGVIPDNSRYNDINSNFALE